MRGSQWCVRKQVGLESLMSKIMLGLCLVIACLPSLAAADEWGNVVALSKNLKAGGKFVEARKVLLAALDDAPLSATRIAVAYNELGTIAQDQGKYTEAERLYRLSIQQWELVPGHLGIARTMNNLASLLFVVGKTDAADVWLRRAETLQIQAMGTDHPETARLYQNRATLYLRFQQYKKAEVEYRKALEVWEKSGPAYELEIASDARGLAIICRQTSRSAEAVGYNERARAIW
jgi:tetratricopeptide (TPR) repeat protein